MINSLSLINFLSDEVSNASEVDTTFLPHLDQWLFKILDLNYGGSALFVLITTICATLISGAIGFEREKKGHSAGLRTHILVGLGSSLIMCVSILGTKFLMSGEPYRLAAQVVSGIGFLGAGTIIQTSTDIKGLTTASTLWLCGGLGLACGTGFVVEAIIVGVIAIVVLLLLGVYETRSSKFTPRVVVIVDAETPILKTALEIADRLNCYIIDITSSVIVYRTRTCSKITFQFDKKLQTVQLKAFTDELKQTTHPYEIKASSIESIRKKKVKNPKDK